MTTRSALALAGLLCGAALVSAQSVTVTKPGEAPTTVACPLGCTVTTTIPAPPVVVEPPPLPACTFTVTPTALSFPAAGGRAIVLVTPSRDGCTFTATGSNDWLTLDASASAVLVTAGADASVARATTATIAGQAVTVSQGGVVLPPIEEPPPTTVGTVLARLDCSRGFPACGGSSNGGSPFYTLTRSGNGARIHLVPGSTQAQFYTGWALPGFSSTAQALYIRFYLTIHAPFNPSAVGDVWTNKFIIVNDGSTSAQRAIAELRPDNSNTRIGLRLQQNISGGATTTPTLLLDFEHRYAVQMEIRRGTNGRNAIWLDNQAQAMPTGVSGIFNFGATGFRSVGVGFYSNAALSASGAVDYTVQDVVVGDTFDPNFR